MLDSVGSDDFMIKEVLSRRESLNQTIVSNQAESKKYLVQA